MFTPFYVIHFFYPTPSLNLHLIIKITFFLPLGGWSWLYREIYEGSVSNDGWHVGFESSKPTARQREGNLLEAPPKNHSEGIYLFLFYCIVLYYTKFCSIIFFSIISYYIISDHIILFQIIINFIISSYSYLLFHPYLSRRTHSMKLREIRLRAGWLL